MTSYNIQRNSQRISNQNDNPNNKSFENVFHGIYNDVLNHATITDDCETFISAKERGESSCSFKGTRDMFFTANRSITTNSIPSSVASSDMLSTSKTNDDDLSYITEPGSLLSNIGEVVQASEIDRSLKFIVELGNDEPSNLRRISEAPNIFGIGVQKEFGRSISAPASC